MTNESLKCLLHPRRPCRCGGTRTTASSRGTATAAIMAWWVKGKKSFEFNFVHVRWCGCPWCPPPCPGGTAWCWPGAPAGSIGGSGGSIPPSLHPRELVENGTWSQYQSSVTGELHQYSLDSDKLDQVPVGFWILFISFLFHFQRCPPLPAPTHLQASWRCLPSTQGLAGPARWLDSFFLQILLNHVYAFTYVWQIYLLINDLCFSVLFSHV